MGRCFEHLPGPWLCRELGWELPRMLASTPLSVWHQPLARGCGPGGQVAFAHAASLTLWSQVKMEVGWQTQSLSLTLRSRCRQPCPRHPGLLAFRPSSPSYFDFANPRASFLLFVIQGFGDMISDLQRSCENNTKNSWMRFTQLLER